MTGATYENRHRDHLDCIMFAGIRFATTLRLSTDVDLLVLDGKKVSSSLLRGADSIELDNGPHQLVFRVEKTIHLSNSEERLYISPPLVVSFNTQLINQSIFACLARRMSGKLTILMPRRALNCWMAMRRRFR